MTRDCDLSDIPINMAASQARVEMTPWFRRGPATISRQLQCPGREKSEPAHFEYAAPAAKKRAWALR
jgi:hypothetical protein